MFPDDLTFCPPFRFFKFRKRLRQKTVVNNESDFKSKRENEKNQKSLSSPPIKKWENLENWSMSENRLKLDKEQINAFCRSTERFVLAGTWINPFEKMQQLRGPEKLFSDLKRQPAEFFELLRQVHEFYLKELELWAQTEVDGLCLMDDWGGQKSLLISPELFRQLFKPLYADYALIAKKYNKYLFFHSDGYILDLLPDFIELGINAINCQVLLMGVNKLASFRGQITFWGSSDLPIFLGQASEEEISNYCKQLYDFLWEKGGFIAQVEIAPEIKISALKTYFLAWKKFL
ncbi:MAG: methyltransferase [Candidatus Aminicenantes bacterium]|nr:methyltransferase [Candidatus Aminicenantes bacterium]